MSWAPIKKLSEPWRVQPHLLDYEKTCAGFTWGKIRHALDGLPGGLILNIAHEAVDRHAAGPRRNQPAIRWLGQDGAVLDLTYADLKTQTNRFANVLAKLGVDKGDRVFTLTGRIPELDINPMLADEQGVMALDARIKVVKSDFPAAQRLSICPYPKELEETLSLSDGQSLLIRPIRPEDEPALHALFSNLSMEEIRLRFLHPMKILPHNLAARLTQIDYDREVALVLCEPVDQKEPRQKEPELYGVVRFSADPDNERAEFAILLRRDMTGMGLGPMLMRRIIDYAKNRGVGELFGEVLAENKSMLRLCNAFGFSKRRDPEEPGVMAVSLAL